VSKQGSFFCAKNIFNGKSWCFEAKLVGFCLWQRDYARLVQATGRAKKNVTRVFTFEKVVVYYW